MAIALGILEPGATLAEVGLANSSAEPELDLTTLIMVRTFSSSRPSLSPELHENLWPDFLHQPVGKWHVASPAMGFLNEVGGV